MTVAPGAGTRTVVSIDGCAVSYQRAGAGAPLLFLHGAGGVRGWLPWMERLSASYDVIVPDHPGWGRSETPDWFDNVHDIAYFYLDFMSRLGLSGVHLVGSSIGGWIACEIAIRNTSALATMTLVDPAGLRVPGVKKFDIFLNSPEAGTLAAFYDKTLAARQPPPATPDEIDVLLRNRFASARIGWQPRLYDPHLAKWLHRVDIPTLVVWGENDEILPVAMQPEFVRLIPGARALTIPRCGHLPLVEAPDTFIEHFRRFTSEAAR